jgi:transcriptional regulator with XRE-family HTH domain
MDLATSLRVLRIVRGWQGRQLAKAARVPASSLSEYETGKKAPSFKTLRRVILAMGYSMNALEDASELIEKLRGDAHSTNATPTVPGLIGLLGTLAEDFEGSVSRALRQHLKVASQGAEDL